MRTILSDDYIREKGKLFQTIPLGVEVPHIRPQDQISDKPPPGQKKAILKKSIKPRQQVESVITDAINGLGASGDANLLRKTGAMLYLDIQRGIFDLRRELDESELGRYTGPQDPKIFDDLLTSFVSSFKDEAGSVIYNDAEVNDMDEADKIEIINAYGQTDSFVEFIYETGPEMEDMVKHYQRAAGLEEYARNKISELNY